MSAMKRRCRTLQRKRAGAEDTPVRHSRDLFECDCGGWRVRDSRDACSSEGVNVVERMDGSSSSSRAVRHNEHVQTIG